MKIKGADNQGKGRRGRHKEHPNQHFALPLRQMHGKMTSLPVANFQGKTPLGVNCTTSGWASAHPSTPSVAMYLYYYSSCNTK